MTKLLTIAACSTLLAFAVPAAAHTASEDGLASLKSPAAGIASAAQLKVARHGADDAPGDDRGGHRNGDSGKGGKGGKGRGGHDDGPNHT